MRLASFSLDCRTLCALNLKLDMYPTICYIGANTLQISRNIQPRRSPGGKVYYALEFEVILLFGLTELKAQIAWKEEVSSLILAIALSY